MKGEFGVIVVCSGWSGGKAVSGPGRSPRLRCGCFARLEGVSWPVVEAASMTNRQANSVEKWRAATTRVKSETYALYLAYRDPRVPRRAKLVAALVLAYAFSPIDLIPDFIPVVGYLDDLLIVPAGMALALRMIPVNVMEEAKTAAADAMDTDKPVNWVMGVVIVLIWIGIAVIGIVMVSRVLLNR
jgi:uncharacterized membrane protein YkvA (DUF1232 family)